MSAPTSPKSSSAMLASESSNSPVQARDNPNRRSIQFSFGSDSGTPSRSTSSRSLRRSRSDAKAEKERKKEGDKEKERGKEKEKEKLPVRSMSPPPPSTYERGVSFDTFDNRDATDFSLTLNYKHKGYQSTRRSRTFLCGTDQNDYSDFALEWLLDELVDDGDEIVCLRAVEKDSRIASDAGIEARKYRQEAEKLFETVIQKNSQDEKAISLVLELAVGKIQDIIQRMIRIYEPAVLIVGTRGRNLNGMQGLLPGSVSKYCLQQSPIPVVVVRPELKRNEKKLKRIKDPSRQSRGLVMDMDRRRSRILNNSSSTDSSISKLPDEETAVAEAVGLRLSSANSRSSLSISERSSISHDEEDPTSPNSATFDAVVMKSPMAGSVENSDNESSGSRPTSGDFSALGEVFDSNTSTPQAGASTPQRPEQVETDTEGRKHRVSIPVIVTEEFKEPSK